MATVARSRIDFENNPAATKPGNLANSAVLRMLEEEEEEQRRSGNNPDGGRRSRSRYREIDRDTVLRINRCRPRRQFSWPPKNRSQSADGTVGGSGRLVDKRDLSLDSRLSHAKGVTAEDLNALQQRGELAQRQRGRRKVDPAACLPPLKPRRDFSRQPDKFTNTQNNSAKSKDMNSQRQKLDSGASDNLDVVQSSNDSALRSNIDAWHSSPATDLVFTMIETPVYCLFCAASDCCCCASDGPIDLSEVEAQVEESKKIIAEGEKEIARQKEAEELDTAIKELIDFASVVKKRPEIMNPAYIPIIEGCLQELALLAMLHSQGRIALRPSVETPSGAFIEEIHPTFSHSSQSATSSDTGICRNLTNLTDDTDHDNHNIRYGRATPESSFTAERFIPTEGLRRVAWPPPSDVSVHPSQHPLTYSQQPQNQQQQQQQQHQQQQYQPVAPASVPAATSLQNQFQTQSYQTTTSYQQQQTTSETHRQQQQQQQYYQPQQNYQQVRQQSPGIVTLRTELPVSQAPAPVYASQPPVFSYKGGVNMRGDQKWPPPEYKQQAAEENEARLRLAAGPACRPRRVNKDYTAFFARNALSHNYPGYRVPPGTQHISNQHPMM